MDFHLKVAQNEAGMVLHRFNIVSSSFKSESVSRQAFVGLDESMKIHRVVVELSKGFVLPVAPKDVRKFKEMNRLILILILGALCLLMNTI